MPNVTIVTDAQNRLKHVAVDGAKIVPVDFHFDQGVGANAYVSLSFYAQVDTRKETDAPKEPEGEPKAAIPSQKA
jgi:hypothetical protein